MKSRVDVDSGAVSYTARIRGIVILSPKSPRYYTIADGEQSYTMLRLVWRLGWMSFSYTLEVPLDDPAAGEPGFIHDLERHANTGGTEKDAGPL